MLMAYQNRGNLVLVHRAIDRATSRLSCEAGFVEWSVLTGLLLLWSIFRPKLCRFSSD